jgi:hypothetical protein
MLKQASKQSADYSSADCLLGRLADKTLLTTVKIGLIPAQHRCSFRAKVSVEVKEGIL